MSEVYFHRLIKKDLDQILEYYIREGGDALADRFFEDAEALVKQIANNPKRFHLCNKRFRRANFRNFPFHFLYEETTKGIKVTVLRHHQRNPKFGLQRE